MADSTTDANSHSGRRFHKPALLRYAVWWTPSYVVSNLKCTAIELPAPFGLRMQGLHTDERWHIVANGGLARVGCLTNRYNKTSSWLVIHLGKCGS